MRTTTAGLLMLAALAGCSRTSTSVTIETTQPTTTTTEATTPRVPPEPRDVAILRSQGNLAQIGAAFRVQNGLFPSGYADEKGKPLLSWRVALLPALGHDDLFRQFKFNEPWDSEHNKKLLAAMPSVYRPVRGEAEPGHTFYQIISGPAALFPTQNKPSDTITLLLEQRCYPTYSPLNASKITDQADRTLLVVEGGRAVPWTKPDAMIYEDGKPLLPLGGQFEGDFNVLMSDTNTVRLIARSVKEELIRAAITPTGGEKLEPADLGRPQK